MGKMVSLMEAISEDQIFARSKSGYRIGREATYECGRPFKQRMVSARFLGIVDKLGAMTRFRKQVPELYVPVHCPPCERKDLTYSARISEATDHRAGELAV